MIADFIQFASERGLIIKSVESDRWVRVPTEDHPHKANGAYYFAGEYAHIQNWATMDKAESWQHKKDRTPVEQAALQSRMAASKKAQAESMRKAHDSASLQASILLRDATLQPHAYLARKGFPDELGFVDADGRLLIPMKDCVTDKLNGIQRIEWHSDEMKFSKKMQHGMKAKGAIFRMGSKTAFETFLVEGYATGLSVAAACRQLRLNVSVIVSFSDSNMVHVASLLKGKIFIYADNDEKSRAGEKAAIKTGMPYCMSDVVGHDANDDMVELGILHVCKKVLEVRRNGI